MQLLHNIVLGKRKWLLSSPDKLHPAVSIQSLIKLEGLDGSPLRQPSFTQNTFPEQSRLCVPIHHGTARTMPFSETQNAVSLANEGDAEGDTAYLLHREPPAQGTCGYFKLFCHILSRHWQLHVNRCFVSTRHVPSPPRLIIQGQAPARLMGAVNRLVYLDWPDLHAVTHIPAQSMQLVSRRSHRRGKKSRRDPHKWLLHETWGNCSPCAESPLGTWLKISQSLPKMTPLKI